MTKQIALLALAFTLASAAAAQASGTGWSCRTCGFSNGTQLTGLTLDVSGGTVAAVVLPRSEDSAAPRSR